MEALGLIETIGLVVAIESADAMLKVANVSLLGKTCIGGGLVSVAITGDVAAVQAAVDAGVAAVKNIDDTALLSQHVIPRPHEELNNMIESKILLKHKNIPIVAPKRDKIENKTKVETKVETKVGTKLEVIEKKNTEPLKIDSTKLNKNFVDKMVTNYGLEKSIEILSKVKVVELRNLARKYKDFGIKGRLISNADKKLLIKEFKKYYGYK
ncbi:BMC domain-containing protein [Clostridium sp. cel8]|jgi:microcompartment protein CcmL/EutN|uniref:BMC domain-containing protein n=1 Tax=unclassified Clostridium TaxID=2614128 RepID=UPI0015F544CD|nr:BMC domain-containing protein [Clostridium sp. cel8]MBA5850008.1 BMC domain-containing protein [Clostridium sp. cel8]